MIYLTRRERFSAAHRMCRSDWSDEKNAEVYGKCSNPNWHGHNYTLYVTVRGEINPETGCLVDIKTLGAIIREHIIEKIDHRNINLEVDMMQGMIASSENLATAIWRELDAPVAALGATLHRIRIEESENNIVELEMDK